MRFLDLVDELAAEERAETLAALEALAPEPVPELSVSDFTADSAQALARELFPEDGEATAWLTSVAGFTSRRSAQRWLKAGECPVSRVPTLIVLVVDEANRRIREENEEAEASHAAAVAEVQALPKGPLARARLAAIGLTRVSLGSVHVHYDDADQGERHNLEVDIDWEDIFTALDSNDLDGAEEAFSYAVLNDYGAGEDLGETLQIDYYDHIELR